MTKNSNRMYGIDILRIMAMAIIFIGHSANQFSCNYSFLSPLIQLRSAAMTLFFMLSGFVLYITYSSKDLNNFKECKNYYIKRVSTLIPTYFLVSILFIIFIGDDSWGDLIKLLPIEILGLQTTVSSLFDISHNGGTWFISCLIISYFFYPYIQEILKRIKVKVKILLAFIVCCFLTYIPFIISEFGLISTYDNPFYRGIEFILGSLLAGIILNYRGSSTKDKEIIGWTIFLLASGLFLIVLYSNITILNRIGYEVVTYFLLTVMILGGAMIRSKNIFDIKAVKTTINYLSGIAYEFFLAQFFAWKISGIILSVLSIEGNKSRILISFIVCLAIASIIHYLFTKPVSKFIQKRFIK